jgi:hypothetical protein
MKEQILISRQKNGRRNLLCIELTIYLAVPKNNGICRQFEIMVVLYCLDLLFQLSILFSTSSRSSGCTSSLTGTSNYLASCRGASRSRRKSGTCCRLFQSIRIGFREERARPRPTKQKDVSAGGCAQLP